ncbi:tripartite tricarboxylate transporter TctB family protein [Mesorhizobium yinganensis]|uniref:tripartite tricarboxylate transporter TctB family protein n=1 Tax=Mesorhizobium yinganensis TaxID=3157707 RepID=UPI0032B851CF
MQAGETRGILSADGLAGLFFLTLGLFFLFHSFGYGMGSLRDIGPGFFPALAGGILAVLGAAVIARGFVAPVSAGTIAWRPLIGALAPVVLFAVSLKTLGLALAAFLLVGVSLALTRQAPLRQAFAASLVLAAFAVGTFGYALQIPLKLWPW